MADSELDTRTLAAMLLHLGELMRRYGAWSLRDGQMQLDPVTIREGTVLATFTLADVEAMAAGVQRKQTDCQRCNDEGWICEAHPALPFDHDRAGCGGAGCPCPACNPMAQAIAADVQRAPVPLAPAGKCQECDCQTGGATYCYEHKPYTVTPKADGSFVVDRYGQRRRVSYEPPDPEPVPQLDTNEASKETHG